MKTWKVLKTFFPILKFNIRLMNFLGSQQYLRNIFNRKKLCHSVKINFIAQFSFYAFL